MTEVLIKEKKEPISKLVEELLSKPLDGPEWLKDLRTKSMKRFLELGIPTPRQEPWRFTNLKPLREIGFRMTDNGIDLGTLDRLAELPFTGLGYPKLVFLNGEYIPEASAGTFPEGLLVQPISEVIRQNGSLLKNNLGKYLDSQEEAFTSLNTALFKDGALVRIAPGAVVQDPIQLLFITSADEGFPVLSAPRVLILSGENSQASVIESHIGIGKGQYLTIPVTEVFAGENSVVDHYRVQLESDTGFHIGSFSGIEEANTNLSTMNLSLSGQIIRTDTAVKLDGEGGWAELDGLFLTNGEHHVDNYTTIHHAKPHCDSREHYKGILSDRSKGVFRGRIIVAKDAQKTDSKQTNNNLLLSDDASINTKPQLEIYADDVKCTHGATIGQLDEKAIFYLRARGISKSVAYSMLIYAFAGEICQRIKAEELKQEMNKYLFSRLPHGEILRAAG